MKHVEYKYHDPMNNWTADDGTPLVGEQRHLRSVLFEVEAERHRQDSQWGGVEHDDTHSSHDWVSYVCKFLGRSVMYPFKGELFRDSMLKVAAVAVAAIQWYDRLAAIDDGDR